MPVPDGAVGHDLAVGASPLDLAALELLLVQRRVQAALAQQGAVEFIDRYSEILEIIGAGYSREGKHYLTLAIGCTGGKHRSVVMARQFADRLSAMGVRATVVNRDLGRE